jgi:hypothetical protein
VKEIKELQAEKREDVGYGRRMRKIEGEGRDEE